MTFSLTAKEQNKKNKDDKEFVLAPYLAATGTTFFWSGLLLSWNRYVMKSGFAQVDLDSFKDNINTPLDWDSDVFTTNMLGHAYQGALYFDSARTFGVGFYPAIAYSFLGSLTWEYACERNNPSLNDMITTSFQTVGLGEPLFRISDSIVSVPSSSSFERVIRELSAFAISPGTGFARLVSGKTFKEVKKPQKTFPLNSFIYTGVVYRPHKGSSSVGMDINFDIEYGTLFEKKITTPFEYFNFNFNAAAFQWGNYTPVTEIGGNYSFADDGVEFACLTRGLLFCAPLYLFNTNNSKSLGLFFEYSFEDSQARGYSSMLFGPEFNFRKEISKSKNIQSKFSLGYAPYACDGFLDFEKYELGTSYTFGYSAEIDFKTLFYLNNKKLIDFGYKHINYWSYANSNNSDRFTTFMNTDLLHLKGNIPISHSLYISPELNFMYKYENYNIASTLNETEWAFKLYFGYSS